MAHRLMLQNNLHILPNVPLPRGLHVLEHLNVLQMRHLPNIPTVSHPWTNMYVYLVRWPE
jgi:hypothetical protein